MNKLTNNEIKFIGEHTPCFQVVIDITENSEVVFVSEKFLEILFNSNTDEKIEFQKIVKFSDDLEKIVIKSKTIQDYEQSFVIERMSFINKENEHIWFNGKYLIKKNDGKKLLEINLYETSNSHNLEIAQKIFSQFFGKIIHINNTDELYKNVEFVLDEILKVENYYLAIIEDEQTSIDFKLYKDEYDKKPKRRIRGKGFTELVIKQKKIISLNETEIINYLNDEKIDIIGTIPRYYAAVPLIIEDNVIGVLAIQRYASNIRFSSLDLQLLEFIGNQIVLIYHKIERSKQKTLLDNKILLLNSLYEITKATQAKENEYVIFHNILTILIHTFSSNSSIWARLFYKGNYIQTQNYDDGKRIYSSKIEAEANGLCFIELGLSKTKSEKIILTDEHFKFLEQVVERIGDFINNNNYQKLIKEQEEKFRSIIHFANNPIFIVNPSGLITVQNNFALNLTGFEKKDLLNKSINTIISIPNYKTFFEDKILKLLENPEELIIPIEAELQTKTNNILSVEVTTASWITGQQRFFGFFVNDITKRKEAEKALLYRTALENKISEISTNFLQLGIEKIEDGINLGLKNIGRFVNAKRVAFFGIDKENHKINCLFEWSRTKKDSYFSHSQNLSISLFSSLLNNLTEGIVHVTELSENKLVKKVLQTRKIKSAYFLPIYINNEFWGFISFEFSRINTKFKPDEIPLLKLFSKVVSNAYENFIIEKEKKVLHQQMLKLLKAVEQSENSIVITDTTGAIEYVNPKFETLTGYSSEEVIGKNPRILKTGHTSKEEYKNLWESISNGHIWKGTFKNRTKLGNFFWESAIISPVKNNNGTIINYIAIKEDITEQIHVKNQLALAQKMEAIGILAAGIAHEINTPLQFIGDNTTFINEGFTKFIAYNKIIHEQINKFEHKSNQELFDLIEKKQTEFDLKFLTEEIPIAINQTLDGISRVTKIVKSLKEFSHPSLKDKQMEDLNRAILNTTIISKNEYKYVAHLITDLDENLPLYSCYLDKLNQVFLNMIVNASHAIAEKFKDPSPEKGEIKITSSFDENSIFIEISDNGCGIPEENLEKIFNPFFTTKEVGKGTGQGLAIVHDIVYNEHQGYIDVSSKIGEETTFLIVLPLVKMKKRK